MTTRPPTAFAHDSEIRLIWMTCIADGLEHGVTDANMALGSHHGRYDALCGHPVLPRPMTCPPGQRCPRCRMSQHHKTINTRCGTPILTGFARQIRRIRRGLRPGP
jgi:hypothetical protein